MKPNKVILIAVAVASVVLLFLVTRRPAHSRVIFKPSAAAGQVLAEAVQKLMHGSGSVLVISSASAKSADNSVGEQLAAFRNALRNSASAKIAAVEWLPEPAHRVMVMGSGGATADQILALMDKHPDATAVAIFGPLPALTPALADRVAKRQITAVAACGYDANVRGWLEAKTLSAAVIPRFGPAPEGTPKTTKDWFNQEYQMVDPQTVNQLPY